MADKEQKLVMVADGDAAMRILLRELLVSEGYRVFSASDGREAGLLSRLYPVDLVVVDLPTLVRDLGEWIGFIRLKVPDVKVLLISEEVPTSGRFVGTKVVDGFLRRPFRFRDFLDSVAGLLQ